MRTRGFGVTDVGAVRETNEDRFLADDAEGLYIVCDGMGGHAAGERAAELAIESAARFMKANQKVRQDIAGGSAQAEQLVELARQAVREASSAVHEEATRNTDHAGMGCTMTLLVVAAGKAAMAHVGDTRLYLQRDGVIELLSTDHTMAADAVRRGIMSADVAEDHAYSHVLTRCVGTQSNVEVDSLYFDVQPDDRYLLCSDGLVGCIGSLADLSGYVAKDDTSETPQEMVQTANDLGAKDNVTVILVTVEADDDEQKRLRNLSADINGQLDALRGVSIFSKIIFADLLRVHTCCNVRHCEDGEMVVEETNYSDRLCVVLDGRFALRSEGEDTLRELNPGDHIGDTTLLVRQPCRSTLRATASGRLLILRGEQLRELARRRPWLGVSIMLSLAQTLSIELTDAGQVLVEHVRAGAAPPPKSLPRALLGFLFR